MSAFGFLTLFEFIPGTRFIFRRAARRPLAGWLVRAAQLSCGGERGGTKILYY